MEGLTKPDSPAASTGADSSRPDLDGAVLDPRRLLVFAEVARRGSLAAAATALGWTQPAIAQHVKRLERDAGCALVVRTSRGVLLTDAGHALAAHADAVAARLRAAREDLAALATLRAGRVRLAAFPSACATFVPVALARLRSRAPDLDLRLTEAEPQRARELLAAGDIDLAVTFDYDELPRSTPDASEHLLDDQLLLVLPTDHRLAGRSSVHLADLATEGWIAGCPHCRAHLVNVAARRGFVPDIRHSTDDYVVTQTLVATGLGVALLPALALAAARHPRITAVPLKQHPPRRVGVDLPRDLPPGPASRALLEELHQAADTAVARLPSCAI